MGKAKYSVIILMILWQGFQNKSFCQQDILLTQYMNNPLILNPALAGSTNSVAVDVFSRQQWIGIENAPSSYYAGFHFPVNKSMASLGASGRSNQAGPLMYNRLAVDYAYLIRVSRRAFLSLGFRVGADHFNLNLQRLQVIDFHDPEFSARIENEFRPSAGAGFIFFTPTIYFGFSIPHYSFKDVPWASEQASAFETRNEYITTGGINFNLTNEVNIKFSAINRIIQNEINTTTVGLMWHYETLVKAGVSYRLNYAAGIIFGLKINDQMDVTYSYEVPTGWQPLVNKGVHELSLSFNFTKLIHPNRDRRFLIKRIQKEEMNSIRYF